MTFTNIGDKLANIKTLLDNGDRLVSMFYIEPDSGDCNCWKGHTCLSPGKHPRENWKDPDQHITSYERALEVFGPGTDPLLGVGRLAGREAGFWALDVDPRNGGDESLKRLCNDLGSDLSTTRTWRTGRGGQHLEFNYPQDTEITNANRNLKDKYPGLDVRGDGGLIKQYGPHNGLPRLDAPQSLIDLIQTPTEFVGTCSTRASLKAVTSLPEAIQKRCNSWSDKVVSNQIDRFRAEYDLDGWDDLVNAVSFRALIEANSPWNSLDMGLIERDRRGDYSVSSTGVVGLLFDNAPRGGDDRWSDQRIAKCIYSAYTSVKRQDLVNDIPEPIRADLAKLEQGAENPPGIIPEAFWEARPALAHVRQAARSRRSSGEAVLAGLFARFGAMVDPDIKVDTGIYTPLSLNAFTALIGQSGTGKSASSDIPQELLPTPLFSDFADRDGIGMGTGEGLIEAYMEWVQVETGEQDKSGNAKTVAKKRQVHKNVLYYMDEGEVFNNIMSRSGSTLGATIRSAWVGALLGQKNAKEETTRILRKGSYAMGFVIGLQPKACQLMMEGIEYGTPQRFYFTRVTDPHQPDAKPVFPGRLEVDPVQVANNSGGFEVVGSITERLDRMALAKQRGLLVVPEIDGHEPTMRAKLSAFLCALDSRTLITEEDWDLSGIMWAASCEVRDDVIRYLNERKAEEIQGKTQAHISRELQVSDAKEQRAEEREKLERIAVRIAKWVHKNGQSKRRDVSKSLNSNDRTAFFDRALELAKKRGWIVEPEDTKLAVLIPGDSKPAE